MGMITGIEERRGVYTLYVDGVAFTRVKKKYFQQIAPAEGDELDEQAFREFYSAICAARPTATVAWALERFEFGCAQETFLSPRCRSLARGLYMRAMQWQMVPVLCCGQPICRCAKQNSVAPQWCRSMVYMHWSGPLPSRCMATRVNRCVCWP